MRRGWTKSWRKKLDHPLYRLPLVWHYFDFCTAKANIEDKLFMAGDITITVNRGSFVTSFDKSSQATGLSFQNIRSAQKKLTKLGMISKKSTNKFTVITVCNYEVYQGQENGSQQTTNKQLTNNQQTTNKQLTTTKECKEDKELKERKENTCRHDCREIFKFWNEQKITTHRDIDKFIPHIKSRLKLYTPDEIREAISNYATVLNGDEYFFSYRWGLSDFLTRKNGIDKFLTENEPFKNFAKERNGNEGSSQYAGKNKRNGGGKRWLQAEIDLPPGM